MATLPPKTLPQSNSTTTTTNSATLIISNITASVQLTLSGPLDLAFLARVCRNINYFPKRIPCAFIQVPKLNLTGLVFANGRVLVSGLRDEVTARLATRYVARYLQTIGGYPNLTYNNFQILTLIANFDVGFPVDLGLFINAVGAPKVTYSQESPILYYTHSGNVTMMISPRGRITIKTLSSRLAIQALQSIYPLLVRCRSSGAERG